MQLAVGRIRKINLDTEMPSSPVDLVLLRFPCGIVGGKFKWQTCALNKRIGIPSGVRVTTTNGLAAPDNFIEPSAALRGRILPEGERLDTLEETISHVRELNLIVSKLQFETDINIP